MTEKFYSNGKFLITAEYLIMNGATALAVPLKYGQSLEINKKNSEKITWQTNIKNNFWFKVDFDNNFNIIETSNFKTASFLSSLLKAARKLNPNFVTNSNYNITANINFDINWGLGSSSSLISNIAHWANVNPFNLFYQIANGSAYDIACARENQPIIYRINNKTPEYNTASFNPVFKNQLYFAYLGKKQNSEKAIKTFKEKNKFSYENINNVSELTNLFLKAKNISEFASLMYEHEKLIGSILNKTTVKNKFFYNFDGEIKSLGAWGGDFIMIASKLPFETIKKYFFDKGIKIIFRYNEIISIFVE